MLWLCDFMDVTEGNVTRRNTSYGSLYNTFGWNSTFTTIWEWIRIFAEKIDE